MIKINVNKNHMKDIRYHRGLTLDDLYLMTGIWQPRLSRIERGIFKPKQEEKEKISEALNSSIVVIFPES